ncbi:MAG: polyprenyl synthetase family protein [Alistipes sp.]|nr:polyprenyl synthetase family protein [Alistipes sp.]MBQ2419409.1 polyprenyl synthetase family protein [Alistipes sp.]
MVTLDDIRRPIADRIEEFEEFVRSSFCEKEGSLLADMVEYVLSSRGKGLRPMLTMLSAAAVSTTGDFGKRTMLAAMLIEMIHTASLVHDDVIDESNMRRGQASVNARWQSRNAVIVGDYILARNMDIGLRSGQYDLLTHIIGNMAVLCEGEILQSDHAGKLDISKQDYFDIIYKKTASLFASCASAGAISVGAQRRTVESMHRFGEMVGMAFQIVDDILDYTPDNNTGKPAANDLQERKITLPLIEVLEKVTPELKRDILSAVERAATDSAAVDFVRQQVVEYGGVEAARATLQRFLQRALSELSALEDTPYRQALIDLCTFVAERDR